MWTQTSIFGSEDRTSKLSKYCRFNEAVLNDEVTKQEVQKDLTEWVLSHDDATVNLSILWEGPRVGMSITPISSRLRKQS